MNKEIYKSLNKFICSDALGIIEDMLYHKCRDCGCRREEFDLIDIKGGEKVCFVCFSDSKYSFCNKCNKSYDNGGNDYCYICNSQECLGYRSCDECNYNHKKSLSYFIRFFEL